MRHSLLASFALCAAAPLSSQFDSHRVSMQGRLTLADFGSTFLVDCWGYTSPAGREYALVCLSQGTAVVEITDPAAPTIVSIQPEGTLSKDVKVYGDHYYSTSDGGPSFAYDLSNVDAGVVTSLGTYTSEGSHNLAVDEVSGFLYHAVGGPLRFFDLSDPSAPASVGNWPGETHDVQVVTYTSGVYAGRQIAFVFAGGQRRVDIVDVTDKANPFVVAEIPYPSARYTHQGWLSEDRRHLYVNDELDNVSRTSIFDVATLESASYVGDFAYASTSTDHNLYWRDGYLIVANYSSGMRVFDARDPVSLSEVGWFDTYPANNNSGFIGAWTAYPYFASGTVVVTDQSNGLFVLDVTEATTPARVATRNAGVNPSSYTASPAILGGTWTATVDTSTTGHTTAQVAGFASPATLPLVGGQVLLGSGARVFLLPPRSGPLASWNLPVPLEPALAGASVATQAVHLFGVTPFALSNAQDVTVGFY